MSALFRQPWQALRELRPQQRSHTGPTAQAAICDPDNLIRVILHGIAQPVSSDLGYMPPFRDSMNAGQIIELVSSLRQRFAPDKQPWTDVAAAVDRAIQANVH